MQVSDGIDLVGSGRLGFELSSPWDSHIYLVHDGDEAVLIDAGCGLASSDIVASIRAAGVDPATVSRILVTHAHADHAAGASSLARLLGAQVCASGPVARILEAGDEMASGLASARHAGVYPPGVRLTPTAVTHLTDTSSVTVGSRRIEVVRTPGHAAGHLAFVIDDDRRVVFSGDLVFSRGRIALLATTDSDIQELRSSVAAVAKLQPDVLLAGHGELVMRRAEEHLAVAVGCFDNDTLPPPFVH